MRPPPRSIARTDASELAALVDAPAWLPPSAASGNPAPVPHLPTPKYRSPFLTQLRWLCSRLLRNSVRHPFLIAVNFTATLATALFLGLVFRDAGRGAPGFRVRGSWFSSVQGCR